MDNNSMSQYTLKDFVDDGHECPVCGESYDSKNGVQSHFGQKHPEKHLTVEQFGTDRIRELYSRMSENKVAKELGVSRDAVKRALEYLGVDRRGHSEAEVFKNEQRSEEERREQTRKARQRHFEKYGDSGHIYKWVSENPEKHREIARKYAGTGADARERNGMAGRTGPDHPRWSGGKSIYDAVKKCIKRESWNTTRERIRGRAGYECEMCGVSESELERALDVHHIVPILAGGCNHDENLIALCTSCHHKTEWYTRTNIPELEPVLVE